MRKSLYFIVAFMLVISILPVELPSFQQDAKADPLPSGTIFMKPCQNAPLLAAKNYRLESTTSTNPANMMLVAPKR